MNVYLKPEAVCEMVPGLTKGALAQLRYKGAGPRFLKPTPKTVLYREADVIEWLEGSEYTRTDRPTRVSA
jgi:hypothetical protein